MDSIDMVQGTLCPPTNAAASWLTEMNETYLIRLSGIGEYVTGEYGIIVDDGRMELLPEPDNNDCENATVLELNRVVEGTVDGATGTEGLQDCSQAYEFMKPDFHDVWYSIVGTGEVVTVSTCTSTILDNLDLDTVLGVYTGNCTMGLTCVAANDNDDRDLCSGPLAGVSWLSELNVIYLIRISLLYYSAGTFGVWAYSGTPDGQPIPESSTVSPNQIF